MTRSARARRWGAAGVLAAAVAAGPACGPAAEVAGDAGSAGVPQFQVDPWWPRTLPNTWILGQVAGLAVDERDHVWIVHRPHTVSAFNVGAAEDPPTSMCCIPAPPVIEFDPDGNVARAWGGPGDGYDWFANEHGIHVDHQGYVWVAGNGPEDHHLLKFTRDGEFVLQIGAPGRSQGSNDPDTVNRAADMDVDPETNELYVADGYGNRRVVVFDAETGEYRRHWGSFGEPPTDEDPGPYDPAVGPSRQFRTPVHGVAVSRDGFVYVADRPNNRIQVFRKDGEYVREVFIRPDTLGSGSVWDLTLSEDPEQRWLYVPDGTNDVIWILERATMEVADHYDARGGRGAGRLVRAHNLGVDSQGSLYVAEVEPGHRVQKFVRTDR